MSSFTSVGLGFPRDLLAQYESEATARGLPIEGIVGIMIARVQIACGKIDPSAVTSAQLNLEQIADWIEQHGVRESNAFAISATIRNLAQYASTEKVMVTPINRLNLID